MGQLDYLRFKLYKTHRCKKSLFKMLTFFPDAAAQVDDEGTAGYLVAGKGREA